ncbi:MAG: hypothetical protein J6Q10_00420, partial [Clostridia bacterium]|nr:hypothetical protein [Clostridia bacterium]
YVSYFNNLLPLFYHGNQSLILYYLFFSVSMVFETKTKLSITKTALNMSGIFPNQKKEALQGRA